MFPSVTKITRVPFCYSYEKALRTFRWAHISENLLDLVLAMTVTSAWNHLSCTIIDYNIICLNEAYPVLHTEWHQSCLCFYDRTWTQTRAIWIISKSPQTYQREREWIHSHRKTQTRMKYSYFKLGVPCCLLWCVYIADCMSLEVIKWKYFPCRIVRL
jgi:hypothetical protein